MSEWTARISEHRIWNLMAAFGPTLDQALHSEEIEPTSVQSIERLRAVLAICGKRLAGSDALTIAPSALDSIAGAIESQQSEVAAFMSDRNPSHLVNANGAADTASTHLAQIPGIASSEELIALMRSITSYRSALDEQLQVSSSSRREAKSQVEALMASLSDLKAQLDAERQKVTGLASEQQKAFA